LVASKSRRSPAREAEIPADRVRDGDSRGYGKESEDDPFSPRDGPLLGSRIGLGLVIEHLVNPDGSGDRHAHDHCAPCSDSKYKMITDDKD